MPSLVNHTLPITYVWGPLTLRPRSLFELTKWMFGQQRKRVSCAPRALLIKKKEEV
jgi:hypothetical protein